MSVDTKHIRELLAKSTDGAWKYAQGTPAGIRSEAGSCWIPQDRNDAELIAAMRNAIPELLAVYDNHTEHM